MKKDFASKSKKRGNATRFNESKQDNNIIVTLVMGLALGVAVTLAAFYYYQPSEPEIEVAVTEEAPEIPSAKQRYKSVPADEVEEPVFSFHNDLKNKTLEIQPEELPPKPTVSDDTVIMQCGSFRELSMAETLRAKIAFNGFEPRIRSTVNQQGNTWYRVQLGPFKSKRNANRIRNQLRSNGIEGCAIW